MKDFSTLAGQRVTVTNPDNPDGTWTGTLTSFYDEPVLILELDDGSGKALPQRFTITPADPERPAEDSREDRPGPSPVRARTLHTLYCDDGTEITVGHVYLAEGEAGTCAECGSPAHDPGLVRLDVLTDGPALLTAEQALVLANRITRAANLILESEEDPSDIAREAARFAD